jgi:hypothetical protein
MHPPSEADRWVNAAMHHYYQRDAEGLARLVRQLAERLPATPPVSSPPPPGATP